MAEAAYINRQKQSAHRERGGPGGKRSATAAAHVNPPKQKAHREERERETDGAAGAKTLALPDTAAVKYKSYFYGGP